MSDSTFHADLDALVRGEFVDSNDELTRFVTDLYGEEQNVTMPNAMKLRIANDLGLTQANEPTTIPAPVSRRTLRAVETKQRSTRPWAIGLGIAAAVLLVLTAVLRWGMPTSNNEPDNRFLFSSPAVPTVSATPDATPGDEADWLLPAAEAECTEDELMDRAEWSQFQSQQAASYDPGEPRVDEPYSPANIEDAEAVVDRQLQSMACINRGAGPEDRASAALPIESPRRAWEIQADPETFQAIQEDRLERSKNFSSWVEDDLGLTPADLSYLTDGEPGLVWLPSAAIELGDGRIALLPGWLVPEEMTFSSIELHAPVWIAIDGEWMFEEELFFCIGECDEFWSQYDDLISNISTPAASPEATPSGDLDWLVPISADECTIEDIGQLPHALPEEFDAFPRRQYTVTGPANPADAEAANQALREYTACEYPPALMGDRLQMETSLSGSEFSPFTIVLLDQQMEDGMDISAAFEANGLTPADVEFTIGADNPVFIEAEGEALFLFMPQHALQLEDGRIAMPMAQISVTQSATARANTQPFAISTTIVMVQDNGMWKVDAQLPLCVGDCEAVWNQIDAIRTDALWLQPISIEECERNDYLPDDLSQTDAAAIRSRQYRACEEQGDVSQLQGPEFRVTEGDAAREISDEIEGLHRQNGERAGSLQRIVNLETFAFASGIDLPDTPWSAYQPTSVVTLQDERIAVLETSVVTPDGVGGSGRTSPVVTTALVWIVDGDTWLLDEEVTVCLGNCDSFWGVDDEVAEATPVAQLLPATCDPDGDFAADFTSHPVMPVGLRPGPGNGSGLSVATIPSKTPLQYLCENAESTDLKIDRMEEGQLWLKVRTEDGTEGWIREIDVQPLD